MTSPFIGKEQQSHKSENEAVVYPMETLAPKEMVGEHAYYYDGGCPNKCSERDQCDAPLGFLGL
jgi:hypothetical protein